MKNIKKLKNTSIYAALLSILMANSAFAENRVDFRLEGDVGGAYNSNIAQINGFGGDFINTYTLSGTARYIAPTQTQILARVQGQYNKFFTKSDFDVMVFAGSFNLSQWFFNSLNVYVGVQPIQLVSLSSQRRPFDMVYLGGLTYYYPFGKDIAFAGYQLDKLNASAQDFSSINNTFLLGLRHSFTDKLYSNVSARVRLRNLDLPTIPDDTRYTGLLNFQYLINDWLTLQVGGDYTQITSSAAERNTGVFNVGVNIIGGYNNSLSF